MILKYFLFEYQFFMKMSKIHLRSLIKTIKYIKGLNRSLKCSKWAQIAWSRHHGTSDGLIVITKHRKCYGSTIKGRIFCPTRPRWVASIGYSWALRATALSCTSTMWTILRGRRRLAASSAGRLCRLLSVFSSVPLSSMPMFIRAILLFSIRIDGFTRRLLSGPIWV